MGSSKVQEAQWGAAPEAWVENERFGIPLYEAVFAAVAPAAGTRLLDVGCGAGLALQMAAARGATVSGLDAAEGMLGVARSRVPAADVRQGDMEALPYPDDSFDLVTAFNSVQFAADPVAALREARRVVVPGGRIAIVIWGPRERCDTRFILSAIAALLPPPAPGAAGPFALSAPGRLEEVVDVAGLTPLESADIAASFAFPDLETAVRIQSSAGPMQRAMELAGEAETLKVLTDAFAAARRDNGSYRLDNVFRYLIARS